MNVADDDINIGIDASKALQGLGQVGKAFEEAARAAGVTGKAFNQATSQMERGIATVAGAMAKQSAARKADLRTISEQITAEQKLAAIQRAEKNTGVRTNTAGQAINANTGQFADSASKRFYENQIALAERLTARQDDLNRQRERSARQMQLETAFASKFYGVADQGATRMQRVANVLQQIPPATWAAKLSDAQQRIMGMSNSTRYALYDASNSFGIAGAAIAGFGVASIAAAVAHERAFANVARTTQTSAEGYEILRRQIELMSMELPVTFEELTNIASAAGQLGISASGVASFTSTVARLSATTNLSSDAAGVALARFRAFFAEVGADKGLNVTERTFSNLASSILKVGVNSIATESGIVNVATQIASMGQYAGYTANQTIGLAGALSSIGVAPELSRGTITRTFSLIGTAVSKGGEDLDRFAALSGRSASEFKAAWGTENFAGVFTDMMRGLYNVTQSGEDANLMLMDLGFNSVRDRPLLLRLAGAANEAGEAGGLLAQTMSDAFAGWTQNSELALQYSKISQTTAARIQVLGQSFEQLFASMGQQSGGFVGELASGMTTLIRGFEAFSNSDAGQVFGTIAVQGALAVGAIMLLVSAAARGAASLQGIGTAWNAIRTGADGATTAVGRFGTAMRIANLSLGLIGLVATIASVVAGFAIMTDAANDAKRGVQDVDGLVAAMAEDARNGADGITFYANSSKDATEEQKRAATQARDMGAALADAGSSASSAASSVGRLASESQGAAYTFGEAAREYYKSQLLQSEAFQNLFDPSRTYSHYGELNKFMGEALTASQAGIDVSAIDWDKYMTQSIKGGLDPEKMAQELAKKFNIAMYTAADADGNRSLTKQGSALLDFASQSAGVFQDLGPQIQGAIGAAHALGDASVQSFSEMTESGASATEMLAQLSEEQQKVADAVATGFTKFVDVGKLIGLTQQSVAEGEGSAEKYAKAWEDAYGGASFTLEQYLGNFRNAAAEQQNFIANIQQLSASGLVDQAILDDLAAMGPEANRLVQAMVDDLNATGGAGLAEFTDLWGQTGYDSQVAFAVQAQLASYLVRDVLAIGGREALEAFNSELAQGKGVPEALSSVQTKFNANPLDPKVNQPQVNNLTWGQRKIWEEQNRLTTTGTVNMVVPILDGAGLKVGTRTVTPFYAGGYTGNGGKYDEAGVVHRGEFVMNAAATRAIGVKNLYAMMNAAQGGRAAPRGAGYAQGGSVAGGSGPATVIAYLSPEDRELLRSLQPIVSIGSRDIARAQSEANFRTTRGGV